MQPGAQNRSEESPPCRSDPARAGDSLPAFGYRETSGASECTAENKTGKSRTVGVMPACFVMEKYQMRIMGLDFGSKTTGVAVSDPLGLTAQGVETIVRKDENKLRQTCARIEELIREYQIEAIVLGYPKNMNNTAGERAEKTERFKEMLERRTGKPVILWDERLTTIAAERMLMESGVRRENRKAVIDKVAAALILQGYLDLQRQ